MTEEVYADGRPKSRSLYKDGVLLEFCHWSPTGELDGWKVEGVGVDVIWLQSADGTSGWKQQSLVRQDGTVFLAFKFHVDDLSHAVYGESRTSLGFLSAGEIVRTVEELAGSGHAPPQLKVSSPAH